MQIGSGYLKHHFDVKFTIHRLIEQQNPRKQREPVHFALCIHELKHTIIVKS